MTIVNMLAVITIEAFATFIAKLILRGSEIWRRLWIRTRRRPYIPSRTNEWTMGFMAFGIRITNSNIPMITER